MDIWDVIGGIIDAFIVAMGFVNILLGVLVALIVLWSIRRLIRKLRESLAVDSSWTRATATVTEVALRSILAGDSPSPLAGYVYRDALGVEHRGRDEARALTRPVVGQRIRIAYDPDDPEVSHPLHGIRWRIVSWAVIFAVVILLLAGCSYMFIMLGVSSFVIQ